MYPTNQPFGFGDQTEVCQSYAFDQAITLHRRHDLNIQIMRNGNRESKEEKKNTGREHETPSQTFAITTIP